MTAKRPVLSLLLLAATTALPAYADESDWAGYTCRLATTQSGGTHTGTLAGGPWSSSDFTGAAAHGVVDDITVGCYVLVNQASFTDHPGAVDAQVHGSGSGTVLPFSAAVTFAATEFDNVYLCTRAVMTHGAVETTYVDDEDGNRANGDQCALAVSDGTAYAVVGRFVTS